MTISTKYAPVLVVLLCIILAEFFYSTKPRHPLAGLNIEQIVRKYGYPIESHEVVTDDGYILTLHRIPHGHNKSAEKRIPILFMHGFTQSATDFINQGPNKTLSFLLSERGYDIWLGNARGSTWSKRHKILDPQKDKRFWDYSLHEIGLYDVPAFIDYILQITGQDSLHYVGYSQGTSVFFILGSEKPEYISKIRLMTALAPAIFLKDPMGPALGPLVYLRKVSEFVFDLFFPRGFLHEDSLISKYLKHICNENSLFVEMCLHHTFLLHGYNREQVNKNELSLIFSNTPAGVSSKQLMHIIQLMESGNFHQYDLGISKNLERYGQTQPPRYQLSNITAPVALYYSSNDWTINIENIDKIIKILPNVVKGYRVPLQAFNHNDFINARNVVDLLYNAVIEEILKH